MADKDFKVKNKLFVNGLSHNSGVILATNNNLDSHTTVPTQYGGTGTTTSPNAGQVLYSSAGTNYAPTTLSSLVTPVTYSADAPASPVTGQIWVESDSAATAFDPNIVKRQSFTATAAQTVFTTSHTWIEGYEQVYLNGLLLLRTTDYTTSNTNTVTLVEAAAVNDILEVVTVTNFNVNVSGYTQDAAPSSATDGQIWLDTDGTLADAAYIANSIVDAKGDLITATADNTPIRLARGTDGQVLYTNSSTANGLEWSTPSGMTLLSTVNMTQGSTATASFQNISGSYKHLLFIFNGFNPATNNVYLQGRLNSDSGSNYSVSTVRANAGASTVSATGVAGFLTYMNPSSPESGIVPGSNSTGGNWQAQGYSRLYIWNYTDTSKIQYEWQAVGYDASFAYHVNGTGVYNASAAITRADFTTSSGNAGCRIRLYGVN